MEHPPGITVITRSMDELLITVRSRQAQARSQRVVSFIQSTAIAVLLFLLIALGLGALAYGRAEYTRAFEDDASMAIVVVIWAAMLLAFLRPLGQGAMAALRGLLRGRTRYWRISLGPTGLSLPDHRGRRILYADIALVNDDAELLLRSGRTLALAPNEPEEVQHWLAAQLRAACTIRDRGTTTDIPTQLRERLSSTEDSSI